MDVGGRVFCCRGTDTEILHNVMYNYWSGRPSERRPGSLSPREKVINVWSELVTTDECDIHHSANESSDIKMANVQHKGFLKREKY